MTRFVLIMGVLTALVGGAADAEMLVVSTQEQVSLGGTLFERGDLIGYDPQNSPTLFFDHSNFLNPRQIDAVHVLENQQLILSTGGGATLGGLQFSDGDLVRYDPVLDQSFLFFDEEVVFGHPRVDINALHVIDQSTILFSTIGRESIGTFEWEADDLVEFDLTQNKPTRHAFLGSTFFSTPNDIDAVSILPNGNFVLSTSADVTINASSQFFIDGDLIEFNPATKTFSLFFSESTFAAAPNIDAVHVNAVPEASTAMMLLIAAALAALVARARTRSVRVRRCVGNSAARACVAAADATLRVAGADADPRLPVLVEARESSAGGGVQSPRRRRKL